MKTLLEIASGYLGKKEKPGNSGFVDPDMEKDMVAIGWKIGWAWCVLVIKMLYKKFKPDDEETLKLFSASAVQTFYNFKSAGYQVSDKPFVGALVIWQRFKDGKGTWQGHAGLVTYINTPGKGWVFKSYEGNTNAEGSREGDTYAEKKRGLDFVRDGLVPMGFIKIM